MEELTGLHAEAGNDANVAALGEAWKVLQQAPPM